MDKKCPPSRIKARRQRSKSGKRWPKWVRHPRLLKLTLMLMLLAFRIWRWYQSLMGSNDG